MSGHTSFALRWTRAYEQEVLLTIGRWNVFPPGMFFFSFCFFGEKPPNMDEYMHEMCNGHSWHSATFFGGKQHVSRFLFLCKACVGHVRGLGIITWRKQDLHRGSASPTFSFSGR